jgi:hypothetical protein
MPNLVGSAVIITSYTPSVSDVYGPENLTNNLGNRSQRWNYPPVIDAAGNTADFNSCYRVESSTITGPYILGLDHGVEIIQNAVLLVLDRHNGSIGFMPTE